MLWLNLWKDTSLIDECHRTGALWACIQKGNKELIQYFLDNDLSSPENVQRLKQNWKN